MRKESKKTDKKLGLHLTCHRSTTPVNGYTIIPSTGTEGGGIAVGKRFHGAVDC